jgi:hypothetical protein
MEVSDFRSITCPTPPPLRAGHRRLCCRGGTPSSMAWGRASPARRAAGGILGPFTRLRQANEAGKTRGGVPRGQHRRLCTNLGAKSLVWAGCLSRDRHTERYPVPYLANMYPQDSYRARLYLCTLQSTMHYTALTLHVRYITLQAKGTTI